LPKASPASATGGFDAGRAYEHVRRLVEIGPRPPGSDGIRRAQAYIIEQLKSYGCPVEEHDFRGSTPIGDIAMKNIIAKVPGTKSDIVPWNDRCNAQGLHSALAPLRSSEKKKDSCTFSAHLDSYAGTPMHLPYEKFKDRSGERAVGVAEVLSMQGNGNPGRRCGEDRMRRSGFCKAASFLPIMILSSVVLLCVTAGVSAHPNTLPQAVVGAHTIFLQNDTGFFELQYAAILELNKWGRFEISGEREKADLIMVLSSGTHVRAIPDGQYPRTVGLNAFTEESVPQGHTRIALVDPKSGTTLWSDLHKTEGGKVKNGHLLDGLREAFDSYEKGKSRK
jgi:hypothetical protein